MQKLNSLHDLLIQQLSDLYVSEQQALQTLLPQMKKAASTPELKEALEEVEELKREHTNRLKAIFDMLEANPDTSSVTEPSGIVEEYKNVAQRGGSPGVTDAAIIAYLQHLGHVEIAGYGCARSFAKQLNQEEAWQLLQLGLLK